MQARCQDAEEGDGQARLRMALPPKPEVQLVPSCCHRDPTRFVLFLEPPSPPAADTRTSLPYSSPRTHFRRSRV